MSWPTLYRMMKTGNALNVIECVREPEPEKTSFLDDEWSYINV